MSQTFTDKLRDAIAASLRETGGSLKTSSAEVAAYAATRAAHLATISNEPGFDEALIAERDNVLAFAGVSAVRNADAVDARIIGLIHGALAVGVAAL